VLERFALPSRQNKLQLVATKQIAYAYRQNSELSHRRHRYDRIASSPTIRVYAGEAPASMRETSTRNPIPEIGLGCIQSTTLKSFPSR